MRNKKKWLSFLLAMALIFANFPQMTLLVYADTISGECGDNLIWIFDPNSCDLTINGTGNMWDFPDSSSVPWEAMRSEITQLSISDGVTSIGEYAFSRFSMLPSVVLPNSIKRIGEQAFYGCTKLTDVTIPAGTTSIDNSLFRGCKSLTTITIHKDNPCYCSENGAIFNKDKSEIILAPQTEIGDYSIPYGVKSIGQSAFYASSVAKVTIPNSVSTIQDYAFCNSQKLTSVIIPNSVTTIGNHAFNLCKSLSDVNIPSSVTSIGDYTFRLTNLSSITIPGSVSTIGELTFAACFNLSSVTIQNGVEVIDDYAFNQCDNLNNVTIPGSVKSIGEASFAHCKSMTDLTISNGVTKIGKAAFYACDALTEVAIPSSISQIDSGAFARCIGLHDIQVENDNNSYCSENGVLFSKDKTHLVQFPAGKTGSYQIPNNVIIINQEAFSGCSSLTDVIIPTSLIDIGPGAFVDCEGLTEIQIPDCVTTIGEQAFAGCSGFTEITIPGSVTSIGCMAFQYCSGLATLTFLTNNCLFVDTSIFGEGTYGDSSSGYHLGHPAKTVIRGYKDSSAEAYAKKYGFSFETIVSDPCENGHNYVNGICTRCGEKDPDYVPPVDRSELEKAIADATAINKEEYTEESVAALEFALAAADALGESAYQDAVDEVAKAIIDAIAGLEKKQEPLVDKAALDKAIESATEVEKDKYTPGSVAALEATIEAAKAVQARDEATQAEVDAAIIAIENAINALVEKEVPPVVNKEALDAAIEAAEKIEKDRYTPESVSALEGAIEVAKAVQARDDATQAGIDAAIKAVEEAVKNLKSKENTEPFRFDDVKNENSFFYDSVYWAYAAEPQITNGADATHFGPDNPCTRGHVVTFLWRAAGEPAPKSTQTPFTDLKPGAFYEKAVAWAVEEGITKGLSDTAFGPDATCTRGQIVTFLWRFKEEPAPKSAQTPFTDVNPDGYYMKAVAWAVEEGVTKGLGDTAFGPDTTCTRGQVVTFLYRATAE